MMHETKGRSLNKDNPLLLYGRIFDLYRNDIYAILSDGNDNGT